MSEMINTAYVAEVLKDRPREMHKGQAGRVLIVAGSYGMVGAAVLATRGALYSGAGLVKVSIPENLSTILQISVPEAMCVSNFGYTSYDLEEFDAIAVGPGLGVSIENYKVIESILMGFDGPVVIDADGLNCLCEYGRVPSKEQTQQGQGTTAMQVYSSIIPDLIKSRKGVTVLTPHPGEADRLLKAMGQRGIKELGREKAAEVLATVSGAIVLLKGADTIVCTANGNAYNAEAGETAYDAYINTTGNPGMATGGCGDVLTGMTAALLAQGCNFMQATPIECVNAAAYLHGLAGDFAAEIIGEYGMTSADVADQISAAIRQVRGEEE